MDDEALVPALQRRDPEAVREMVRAHGDRLYRSACLLCGSATDAQDLVQETYVQAFRSIRRFRRGSSLYTWLHGILLNLVRHHRRKRWRLVFDESFAQQEAVEGPATPAHPDMEAASPVLAEAVSRLTDVHREVLVLRFFEDMKLKEIATHLGVSTGTVKSRLHYALAILRRSLPAELNLFGPGGTEKVKRL